MLCNDQKRGHILIVWSEFETFHNGWSNETELITLDLFMSTQFYRHTLVCLSTSSSSIKSQSQRYMREWESERDIYNVMEEKYTDCVWFGTHTKVDWLLREYHHKTIFEIRNGLRRDLLATIWRERRTNRNKQGGEIDRWSRGKKAWKDGKGLRDENKFDRLIEWKWQCNTRSEQAWL